MVALLAMNFVLLLWSDTVSYETYALEVQEVLEGTFNSFRILSEKSSECLIQDGLTIAII